MADKMKVHERIREFIEVSKLDKFRIFKEAGLNTIQANRILNGTRKLSADEYVTVCKVLKVNPDTFAD